MTNVAGSARKLQLRRVFNRMDVDGSKSVTLDELRPLCAVGGPSAEELFALIEGNEGNSDGELTIDEWVPFVDAQARAAPHTYTPIARVFTTPQLPPM